MIKRFAVLSVMSAHGLTGELKCYPLSDSARARRAGIRLFADESSEKGWRMTSLKVAGRFVLIRLEGINDKDAADALKGQTFYVDRDQVEPLDEGTWFLADLIGLTVIDEHDVVIGQVREIKYGAAQDVLVIADTGQADVLLPAVVPFIQDVDFAAACLHVVLPDGLLELYRGT